MAVTVAPFSSDERVGVLNKDSNYDHFDRQTWHSFFPSDSVSLTQENLDEIKSLNDQISIKDVNDVYLPLIKLIQLKYQNYLQWQLQKRTFIQQPTARVPYIIGIAGSVAVGKSTTARLLQILLHRLMPDQRVALVTTDGFLYTNAELKRRGLMERKGFPESYDMEGLLNFLNAVKGGQEQIKVPIYSHQTYDVDPRNYQLLDRPNILIVEGINTLQLPSNQQLYISDFFDLSLYVDAAAKLAEQWYLERFGMLLETAFTDPTNYYYPLSHEDREHAFAVARKVWQDINLPNLTQYILPTRNRAEIILHKTNHHYIDQVYLRK